MISRRDFLKKLGIGAGAAVVAPHLPAVELLAPIKETATLADLTGDGFAAIQPMSPIGDPAIKLFEVGQQIRAGQAVYMNSQGLIVPMTDITQQCLGIALDDKGTVMIKGIVQTSPMRGYQVAPKLRSMRDLNAFEDEGDNEPGGRYSTPW